MSGEELQIYRPDGGKFFSYAEVNEQLEQEKQRAEQAQQELEAERQRLRGAHCPKGNRKT